MHGACCQRRVEPVVRAVPHVPEFSCRAKCVQQKTSRSYTHRSSAPALSRAIRLRGLPRMQRRCLDALCHCSSARSCLPGHAERPEQSRAEIHDQMNVLVYHGSWSASCSHRWPSARRAICHRNFKHIKAAHLLHAEWPGCTVPRM